MVKTYDVFCDGVRVEDGGPCMAWVHGTTAQTGAASRASNEARAAARAAGWTRRDGLDLCPRCR